MNSGAAALAGWGAALAAIALLGGVGFGLDPLPTLLLAGAGAACAAGGAAAAIAERRRPRSRGGTELVLRSSAATLVLTAGATLAFVGVVVVGPALLWPGIGFVAVGASGIARELRAARRMASTTGRGGER
jgi:hypothetical protein